MRYDGPMTAVTPTVTERRPPGTRRLGYTIAIVVNGAILFVVHNLLAWGGAGMRAACYWFSETVGVLPAFGRFTGCAMVRPRDGDRVFVVGEGRVAPVGGACPGLA